MAKISSPQGGGLENGARGIEVDFLLGLQQHPRAVLDIPAAPDTSEAQWPLAAVNFCAGSADWSISQSQRGNKLPARAQSCSLLGATDASAEFTMFIGLQNQGSSLGLSFVEGVVIVILQMLAACASQIRCQFRLTPALRALAITILRAVIFQRYQRRTPSAAFLALYVNPSQGMLKRCVTVTPYGVCCPPLTASQNPIRRCRHWKAAEDAGHMSRRGHSSTFTLDLYISARCTQGHMDGMTTTTTGGSRFEPLFQALGAPDVSLCDRTLATRSRARAQPQPGHSLPIPPKSPEAG
ncbi:hypothetical protein FOCG_14221 [Fusarium oxysporum f. sp. radicis-lycopersici 26381]|nr:hypothetical protein FOCG_14221 [Fusarium oxysporum f. sp. radicis-lycopersici 26381]